MPVTEKLVRKIWQKYVPSKSSRRGNVEISVHHQRLHFGRPQLPKLIGNRVDWPLTILHEANALRKWGSDDRFFWHHLADVISRRIKVRTHRLGDYDDVPVENVLLERVTITEAKEAAAAP